MTEIMRDGGMRRRPDRVALPVIEGNHYLKNLSVEMQFDTDAAAY
jgi:hypothetical protein